MKRFSGSFYMSSLLLLCLACVSGGVLASGEATTCATLVKQKQSDLAGKCFERLAGAIKLGASTSLIQRKLKSLHLQNAAKSYQRYAKSQSKPEVKALYHEKTKQLIEQILRQKLCTQAFRCRALKANLWELNNKIGYARLTVFHSRTEAVTLELRGYEYTKNAQAAPRWSGQLRPGTYKLELTFADQSSRNVKVTLKRGEQKTLNIAPYFPKKPKNIIVKVPQTLPRTKQVPPGAWVLGGIGLAIAGGGALLVGLGVLSNTTAASKYDTVKSASSGSASLSVAERKAKAGTVAYQSEFQKFVDAEAAAGALIPLGWLGVLVGAGVMGGAILWGTLATRPKKKQKTSSARPTQTRTIGHLRSKKQSVLLLTLQ